MEASASWVSLLTGDHRLQRVVCYNAGEQKSRLFHSSAKAGGTKPGLAFAESIPILQHGDDDSDTGPQRFPQLLPPEDARRNLRDLSTFAGHRGLLATHGYALELHRADVADLDTQLPELMGGGMSPALLM
jgi:hypothetical protein